MLLKVNPTRMELLRLKKRYIIAKRGHKLLKDKLEGLMREFISLANLYRDLRKLIDDEIPILLSLFTISVSYLKGDFVKEQLYHSVTVCNLEQSTQSIMNVHIPKFSLELKDFSLPFFSGFDGNLAEFSLVKISKLLKKMVQLAEIEQGIRMMASEIEKTRRRVNALEYVLIPNLEETIKFIKSKLDEIERSNITRLLKIKEIIRSH